MTIVKDFIWTAFVVVAAIICLFFMTLGHGIPTHARMAQLTELKLERVLDSPKRADAGWTLRGT
jgi:hypothetical protein